MSHCLMSQMATYFLHSDWEYFTDSSESEGTHKNHGMKHLSEWSIRRWNPQLSVFLHFFQQQEENW